MTKSLVNFDAKTLTSSLEGTQPRSTLGVKFCTFGLVSPSFFTFQLQFFEKSLQLQFAVMFFWTIIFINLIIFFVKI